LGKKLYVGNLDHDVTSTALGQLFEAHGTVESADIIMDRTSNRSKGFGFVEMSSNEEAANAIEALNGHEINGRSVIVNEARPKGQQGSRAGRGRF